MSTSGAVTIVAAEFKSFLEKIQMIPTTKNSEVCVWSVPTQFRSMKKECYTPSLVGLGLFHHSKEGLAMTNPLKFRQANRILSIHRLKAADGFDSEACYTVRGADFTPIKDSYYLDDGHAYNTISSETVSSFLVDGLYLLALLHHADPPMDAVIRDVFMLENQIPTLLLQDIIEVNFKNNFPIARNKLGSSMLNFCKKNSPLVHSSATVENPESSKHLLHLMLRLIAPDPPQTDQNQPEANGSLFKGSKIFAYIILSMGIFLGFLVYYTVIFVQPFLLIIPHLIAKVIPWLDNILHLPDFKSPTSLPQFLASSFDRYLCYILSPKNSTISRAIEEAADTIRNKLLNPKDEEQSFCIPSVRELRKANIQFKPVDGDIYSLRFDRIRRELHLPRMNLNNTSEVILRNLAVYELNKDGSLSFSNYIEFMRDILKSEEDVNILMDENIIQTKLSALNVSQIFKKPIGSVGRAPTEEFKKFEEQVKKVKPAMKNVDLIINAFLRYALIIFAFLVFSPLWLPGFKKTIWCSSIFGNKSQGCKVHQVGDYAGNAYYSTRSM